MKYLGTTHFNFHGSQTKYVVLGQSEDGNLWQLNIFIDDSYTATAGCTCCSHPKLIEELKEQGISFEGSSDKNPFPSSEEWQNLRREHDENPKMYTFSR